MFDNKFEKPQNMDNRSIFERDYAGEPEFMHNENNYLTMLGTGNALATRCYNTCFTLHGKESVLLVDAGGGNGILAQLEKAGIHREPRVPTG